MDIHIRVQVLELCSRNLCAIFAHILLCEIELFQNKLITKTVDVAKHGHTWLDRSLIAMGFGSLSVRDFTPASARFFADQRTFCYFRTTHIKTKTKTIIPISIPSPLHPTNKMLLACIRRMASCPRTYNCRLYRPSSMSVCI